MKTTILAVSVTISTIVQAVLGASDDNVRMFLAVAVLSWLLVCMVQDLKDK